MSWRIARLVPLAAVVLGVGLFGGPLSAAEKGPTKEESAFGALKSPTTDDARAQAEAWLKSAGKTDAASLAQFNKVWATDRPLVDKVSETLVLGSPEAAKVLAEARNADAPAPLAVPAILKDAKQPAFFRANLALAYSKALVGRKVYEEALDSFAVVKPEEVIDPAAYFFHKAVCEHALMLKDQADNTIDRLLVDAVDAPQRYLEVGVLMKYDMVTWAEKDLGWIARKMDNIQRRLDLKRGGKQTQKMQKEVLVRLDEMIKEIENKQKSGGNCPNGGSCPGGAPGSGSGGGSNHAPGSPMPDSAGGNASGPGDVDKKRVREIAEVWGKLPEKERARAMQELTRGLPAKDRAVIEEYFRRISSKTRR